MNFSLYYFSLFFLLLFGPKFGAYIDLISITSIYLLIRYFNYSIDRYSFALILILMLYTIHCLSIFLISGHLDTWHAFQPIRFGINVLGIATFISYLKAMGRSYLEVVSYFELAVCLHAVICIVMFFHPEFKNLVYSSTGFLEKSYTRVAGLTHSYGIPSVMMSLAFATIAFKENVFVNQSTRYLLLFVTGFGLLLTARSGLYIAPILFFFAVCLRSGAAGVIKGLGILSISVLILFSTFDFLTSMKGSYEGQLGVFINESIYHAFEVFVSWRAGGPLEISSLETITKFDWHNTGILEVVFGTGDFGRGEVSRLDTDIAYLHIFSMVGIVGSITLVSIYIMPWIFALIRGRSFTEVGVIFLVSSLMLLMHYKQSILLVRGVSSSFLILSLSILIMNSPQFNPRRRRSAIDVR